MNKDISQKEIIELLNKFGCHMHHKGCCAGEIQFL